MISIIIPTLNEGLYLESCIQAIRDHSNPTPEILIIDAGSNDNTIRIAQELGVNYYERPQFKGKKYKSLNEGGKKAKGDILLFLDADTLVPPGFDLDIIHYCSNRKIVGGAFEFSFKEADKSLSFIQFLNRIRYRIIKEYFGDQGIFVKKSVFEKLNGFPPSGLLEAAHFCRKLSKEGKLKLIKKRIKTSPRRFINGGTFKVFFTDLKIIVLDYFGFDVNKYADDYWKKNSL